MNRWMFLLSSFLFLLRLHADVPIQAAYTTSADWISGYTGNISLTNSSNSTISSWKIEFDLPAGQAIESLWNGSFVSTGQHVTITNESWNGSLKPHETISIGFIARNPLLISVGPSIVAAVGNPDADPTPTPTPTPSSFSLSASYTIDSQWGSGYQATVTITNPTSAPTSSWTATFVLPQGQSINSLWNGQPTVNGQTVTVANPGWSGGGAIASGGSTSFGMVVQLAGSSAPALNQLQAAANGSSPAPTPLPAAPVLQPISINPNTPNSYTVSWGNSAYAGSYVLQQDTAANFPHPQTAAQGNTLSQFFAGQPNGTYYYRVYAVNAAGNSPYSNIQSVTVQTQPTPTPSGAVVEGYWESWNSNTSIQTIVGMKVDVIDIAFANFQNTGDHTYVIAGVEASQETLTQLVTLAHNLGKKVKISVGGASYGLSGQLREPEDAVGMAQAVAQFVQQNRLDGVDFDIEDYPAADLQIALIQNTRQLLGNSALISYTPKTPAATTRPYSEVIGAAHPYLTSISLMAYDFGPGYTYQQDVQDLMGAGVPASKIIIGLMPGYDDLHVMTSLNDIRAAAQLVEQLGLGGIMFWDLNRDHENLTGLGVDAATNKASSILD